MRRLALIGCLLASACAERALGLGGDEPTEEGPPCGTERACKSTVMGGFTQKGICTSERGRVSFELSSIKAAFCNCMHGCGPGLDATIRLRAKNASQKDARLDWARVEYTAGDLIYTDSAKGTCCSPGLRRDSRCEGEPLLWDKILPAGQVDDLAIDEHFDVFSTVPGRYHARAVLTVDGREVDVDLGDVMLAAPTACF